MAFPSVAVRVAGGSCLNRSEVNGGRLVKQRVSPIFKSKSSNVTSVVWVVAWVQMPDERARRTNIGKMNRPSQKVDSLT
jgi:hypothetical protein